MDTEDDLRMLKTLWPLNQPYGPVLHTLDALKLLSLFPEIARINSAVEVKSQSHAAFPNHFKPRICGHCQQRYGSIVEGNLRFFCPGCGEPLTFYAHKPLTR